MPGRGGAREIAAHFEPTLGASPASDSHKPLLKEREESISKMSSQLGRGGRWWVLTFAVLVSAGASALSLQAQSSASSQQPPSSEQKQTQQAPQTPQQPAKTPPKKEEEKPALHLENPTPAQEGEKPQQKPPLKLETPQPAAPPTPGVAQPAAPTPAAPQPAAKPIIEDIIIRGNRRIPASTLRARLFTHKGDVYDENQLERDFMALWNTGYLDDVRFEVTDGDKGKILTIFVREKKLVRSIDYKGLSTVQQSDVLQAYKDHKVGLSIQSQYDPVVIKRAEVVLQELLAEHGRQFATVRHRTRNIPPNSVALTFIVSEGPKVKVGKIRFQGNTVFSNMKLVRAMKLSRPAGAPPFFYFFHKTYDKDKVLYDLEKVRELYQEHGYFYALPKEPQVKMKDTAHRLPFFFWSWGRGKSVDVTVPIEEGAQYKLGKFTIRGNKLFKQVQLAPILQLKTGDVFNLTKVRKSLENYTKLYGQFGYINFTATPDIDPDRKKHIINLALDFDEGKQFFVHRVEFQGNTKTRDKVIRRELLVDEGYVFNTTLWDYSVLRVNQLGFFDKIDKQDYDIKQNAKDGTVDINLKLKEKGRNSIGFSGGISGLAGNFVGINYATNNFLGLGETLSVQAQFGTFEKLFSFGFTEPYFMDRPITTGFTVFKSDYRYDQLRQTAIATGLNPEFLQQNLFLSPQFTQNFQQNSAGFTVFASYPLRRTFARVGLTYTYSVSSLQTFTAASNSFFQALNFSGLAGPNALSGITSSQIMPTYLFNTVDDPYNPKHGKYIYAGLGFAGLFLGGNVNTINPVLELKYFHPINKGRNALGFHFLGTFVSGFGGRVAPPFSRFYIGGEQDVRGFDIRSISPIAFFPTIQQVCNLDQFGRPITSLTSQGLSTGACGSFTKFPMNTIIYPGGDTSLVGNFEYRIPIAGPVTLSYFIDVGTNFILRDSQLQIEPNALSNITSQFPYFQTPKNLRPIGVTNLRPRSSTGLEIGAIMPVINMPLRVYYAYNWLRLNTVVVPPQTLPPSSLFPNEQTYDQILPLFQGLRLRERKARLGFTVARTF